jgi:tRNA(Ile)-lysidine synthase
LTKHGIEHHILTWQGKKPKTKIQETARQARYHLLGEWCEKAGIGDLLTAHHGDDQVETVLMRLSKGSGLDGLCGIQAAIKTSFGRLLRPLLTVSSAQLKSTLERFHQPFLADPSNDSKAFTRVRWRHLLSELASEGLTFETLSETTQRLQNVKDFLDITVHTVMQETVTFEEEGYAKINWPLLRTQHSEIVQRILTQILLRIGGQPYPPRRQYILRLYEALKNPAAFRGKTCARCMISFKGETLLIRREKQTLGVDYHKVGHLRVKSLV